MSMKTLLWTEGETTDPRVDKLFDNVKHRFGWLLTQ